MPPIAKDRDRAGAIASDHAELEQPDYATGGNLFRDPQTAGVVLYRATAFR
mgnify:FL=1